MLNHATLHDEFFSECRSLSVLQAINEINTVPKVVELDYTLSLVNQAFDESTMKEWYFLSMHLVTLFSFIFGMFFFRPYNHPYQLQTSSNSKMLPPQIIVNFQL